jgi:UDP-sugar transporter A1/2/3
MAAFSQIFSIKYAALACLVLQNTFLVIFMHYSRVNNSTEKMYNSSTAVVMMELLKLIICFGVVGAEKGSISELLRTLNDEVFRQPVEMLKLAVPSILYTIQNNLLYFALSHLDAATYQVGYQIKILTTAFFSMMMLGKVLSRREWSSLVLLTIGVALAQLSAAQTKANQSNTIMGFVAVLCAAMTSGFAGVYFEKVLKTSGTSLWVRNIQMGITACLSAVVGIFLSGEFPSVRENGFFSGYNTIVLIVILLQGVGGLIVAVVVKYADNILKGFAAGFSIITSCIVSYFYFDFQPNSKFLLGALLVSVASYLYSVSPVTKNKSESNLQLPPLESRSPVQRSHSIGGSGQYLPHDQTSSTTAHRHSHEANDDRV